MTWELCKIAVYPCVLYLLKRYWLDPEWIIIYAMLIVADMFSGVLKSWVLYSNEDKHWFSWKKFTMWFMTKTFNLWLFCMSIICISYLFNQWVVVFEFAWMSFLIVWQLIGVLHNWQQISLKKEVPEWDFTAKTYDYLIWFLKGILEKITKN